MKMCQLFFIIGMSSVIFSNVALAQNQPLACQGESAAGFSWENNRWVTSNFFTRKFILVKAGNTVTIDSAAQALRTKYIDGVTCRTSPSLNVSCNDTSGGNFYLSLRTLKGGISQILGASLIDAQRDTVSVEIFSCTPF